MTFAKQSMQPWQRRGWEMSINEWKQALVTPPEMGRQVIGFHPEWIDADFNQRGIRECFRTGDGTEWINATWVDHQDCYREGYEAPLLWCEYPLSPTPDASTDEGV